MSYTTKTKSQYVQTPALSKSGIMAFLKGPNEYKRFLTRQKEPTQSMRYGSYLHDMILDKTFSERYRVAPDGIKFNTKEGIMLKKEAEDKGQEIISYGWDVLAKRQHQALLEHKTASHILKKSWLEPFHTWTDEESGVALKTMPDFVNDKDGFVADLKTISPIKFYERAMYYTIKDFGYDIQAAMAMEAFGVNRAFVIFVSTDYTDPEHAIDIAVYELHPDMIKDAAYRYKSILPEFKVCQETNTWPSRWPQDPIIMHHSLVPAEVTHEQE